MPRSIRGQGGHLVSQFGPKDTNLLEDVEILLNVLNIPLKIRIRKRFSKSEAKTVILFFFSIGSKNANLVEGRVFASISL